ncbi:hypothetical protein ACOSP7_008048 [Xanthoceras sorbifolium]|uniref:FLZ-type domain-containing protein n=1 Tax=Xanthoceras sorbifolium TaxID=99658 RepID=A0ABQ8IC47_9ROSI|nr:hypothetical protein JRO89_XS03G0245700 [Xanthoceras sorbifolium]
MQVKRARLASLDDSDASSGGGTLKKLALLPAEQTPRRAGILTLTDVDNQESSFHSHVNVHGGKLASFLEKCHFCSKRMLGAAAFMSGDLRGFCKPECRDKQIGIEKFSERLAAEEQQQREGMLTKTSTALSENSVSKQTENDTEKNKSASSRPPKPSGSRRYSSRR